ncbi:MAG: ornithine carbamoyltransferase [Deltaproteobacteria bacterium]|nr:ornithine carbamoyltransferase [Deltaproteobacteria bacterium]MBN2673124.1 ornithine carbamoyltransferase [Deltaproteobacteria bacterium]
MKKDFLTVTDFTADEVMDTLQLAIELKEKTKRGEHQNFLKGGVGALIFHKQSLRTRCSFEVGFQQLGGSSVYITNQEIELGKRETIHDVAKVMSRYFSVICIRTYSHKDVEELAYHAEVPVVNMLTDLLHPCQLMADMQTILEKRGHLKDLKVTYLGDGNNMTNSWLRTAQRIPMHLSIGTSPDTLPDADILQETRNSGISKVSVHHNAVEAVKDADVIYTDVWASMGAKDQIDTKIGQLQPFQVNMDVVNAAKKDVLVMHCLPAERGREITADVMDLPNTVVFDEAENRLHAQKAVLVKLLQG